MCRGSISPNLHRRLQVLLDRCLNAKTALQERGSRME